jgi:DNA polymerase-3 subunit alpha (Gram-positive type)
MMAFRIAWFKVHEPLAFYSAYFYRRSQKDGFDAEIMTAGADAVRRKIMEYKKKQDLSAKEEDLEVTLEAVYEFYLRGFSFAPIDIYKSDPAKFIIVDDKTLRPPFVAISGLGETAAEDLARCRDSGRKFISIQELSSACPKLSQTHIDTLKNLGALGDMPESSQITLFEM